MLMVIIWTIVLIVDIDTWGIRRYTGFDLVFRDMCILALAFSLLAFA